MKVDRASVEVAVADALSDRIVAAVNGELRSMKAEKRISPLSLLAGQLLGLMATLSTAPPVGAPPTLAKLEGAVRDCLTELMAMSDYAAPIPEGSAKQ